MERDINIIELPSLQYCTISAFEGDALQRKAMSHKSSFIIIDKSGTTIARRRWRWIGHILRKDQGSIPRVAVEWKPEGHRKRGRPKMTWRRTVEAEAKAMGHSWGTLRTLAQDRLRWREFVAALVVYDKKGSK